MNTKAISNSQPKLVWWLIILATLVMASCTPCHAGDVSTHVCKVSDSKAQTAILGEAAGESYEAKLWIACIIRNRDSLQGIYGANVKAEWIAKQPQSAKDDCAKAWRESALHDVSKGCTKFGGKIDDKYFIDKLKLKPVKTIGNTRFYK